jgi:predicted DNA-binding protein
MKPMTAKTACIVLQSFYCDDHFIVMTMLLLKEALLAKDATITFRMSVELKKALQTLAKRDRRSLSTYVEMALEKHAEKEGEFHIFAPEKRELPKPVNVRRHKSMRRV